MKGFSNLNVEGEEESVEIVKLPEKRTEEEIGIC